MVGETKPESAGVRYSAYIDELHDFFRSRQVSFGSPADLARFAELVAPGSALAEEMGSMVRSFVYLEDERLGRSELLELVTVAVGGVGVDIAAPGVGPSLRRIFVFLNGALRQHRGAPQEAAVQVPPAPQRSPQPLSVPRQPHGPPQTSRSPEPVPLQRISEQRSPPPVPSPQQAPPRTSAPAQPPSAQRTPERPVPQPLPQQTPLPHQPAPMGRAPAMSSETVTAGDILAISTRRTEALRPPDPAPHDGRRAFDGEEGELFPERRDRLGERELPEDELPRPARKTRWLVPAAAMGAVAVAGTGGYLARPFLAHPGGARAQVALSAFQAPRDPVDTCAARPAEGVPRAELEDRARWAHSLLDQKLYEAALPELREVARLDPGYPGIRLDESETLLHLKRPEEAREAADAQVHVSECLARLPDSSVDSYCAAQYTAMPLTGCRSQLAHLREAAELQEALVHLDLGHRVVSDAAAAAALAELTRGSAATPGPWHHPAAVRPTPERVAPLPPASEDDAAPPAIARPETREREGRASGNPSPWRSEATSPADSGVERPPR